MTTVLLTGASGFIAKHILRELLDAKYNVKASVRSDNSRASVEALFPEHKITFVNLDLMHDDGWDDAMRGVDVLIHTASPFPTDSPKDAQELIRPAVDGTMRALTSAHKAGVKRVVLTSSCVAIYKDSTKDPMAPSTRDNWTDPNWDKVGPYEASKTLAEKAAWDFVKKHPEMSLTTINPGGVFGPPMDDLYGTSLRYVEMIFCGDLPAMPKMGMPAVDVRDVAKMHVLAIDNKETFGQRFPAVADTISLKDMAVILKEHYPARKISTREIPDFVVSAGARLVPAMKEAARNLGMNGHVDGSDGPRVMGFTYTPVKDAILASAEHIRNNVR